MTRKKPSPLEKLAAAIKGAASKAGGDAFGDEVARGVEAHVGRRDTSKRSQAEAAAISAHQVRRGDGSELEADAQPQRPDTGRRAETKQAVRRARRASRDLKSVFQARRKRDGAAETAQQERMADAALAKSGIRHEFRALPKVAWWAGYMAGLDRNGALALRALRSCNMPRWRQDQVLEAAYRPSAHQPKRNVCTGRRRTETRFQLPDDRRLPERGEGHPGAIRVIQCAIFLWVSKGPTRRRGFSGRVRGFGRGVFAALTGAGKDAIIGHCKGVPGALVALKRAGFVQYGQPPAEKVRAADRGPSGHAYNVYWFPQGARERALEAYHRRMAEVAKLPPLERLVAQPRLLEQRVLLDRGPPPDIPEDSIPF